MHSSRGSRRLSEKDSTLVTVAIDSNLGSGALASSNSSTGSVVNRQCQIHKSGNSLGLRSVKDKTSSRVRAEEPHVTVVDPL